MHSPALAISKEFWKRHRWALSAVGTLVLGFAIVCAMWPPSRTDAMLYSIWFAMGLCYVIGVFSYGFESPLESAESGFPARFYILPVRTSLLVGSPMVQGMIVSVGLWVCWEHFVLRPGGVTTPSWWPVMLAAIVATAQAILWFPFGLPWLRLLVGCVILFGLFRAPVIYDALIPSLGASPEWLANPNHQNSALMVLAAIMIPLAFLVARVGVSWARRGDSPNLQWLRHRVRRPSDSWRTSPPFTSAMQAQMWYEWRLRGRGYMLSVIAILVLVICIGLFLTNRDSRYDFGLIFLMIPPLIAGLGGAQMGSPGESIRSTAMTTFAATRPLDEVALVSAKLRAITWTAAITWAIVLAITTIWTAATGGFERLELLWEGAVRKNGSAHATGFCVLLAVGLVLGTWRALVANLWVGLSGRIWLVPVLGVLISSVTFQFLFEWMRSNGDEILRDQLLVWLQRIVGAAVVLKFFLTAWALHVLHRRGQLGTGATLTFVGIWILVAVALFSVFWWLVPSTLVSLQNLALGIVLLLPLGRLSVAPLALAWNRHR